MALPASGRADGHVGSAERLAYLGLFLCLTAIVLLSSRGYFTPDIKPEVYLNPLRRLAYDLSAWQPDPQLGVGNYNNGLAPVSGLTSVLHAVGLPPDLIARLLRLTLLTLGAWGAVRFYRAVAGPSDVAVGRVMMAAVFLFNPYAVVGGATLAVLLPYCILPWQLLALLRALQSGRGWRWPAVFALTFFAMSGMNVAAVPVLQLVSVPAVLVHARRTTGQPWGRLLLTLGRCLLLAAMVSVYWVLPAVVAYGWGSTVAAGSETVEGIASPSSFAEVLRGLGLWPMYGRNVVTGPWTPGFTTYLTNGLVIGASFALVATAALAARVSRSRTRVLAVIMLASVAVVMVGVHPPGSSSPFGQLLTWIFANVPGSLALRTTNKAGAGLALALAILLALGAVRARRGLTTHGTRLAAIVCAAFIVVGAAWPAFAGTSYVGRWKIPGYWTDATTQIDTGRTDSRVWFLPGQVLAHYRWNTEGPDDVNLSLVDRPSLLRTVLPVSSAETTNLLAGVDSALQEGRLGGRSLSAVAHYLGVDTILLRNDTVWEDARGGRPATVQPQVDSDAGLTLTAVHGRPGQSTATVLPGQDPEADAYERLVEPLRTYQVAGTNPIIRSESLQGMVLVDGDGFAVPALVNAGVLAHGQSFRYVGEMDPASFAAALGSDRRIVLTDSNRRRDADDHHLTDAFGPLVAADVPVSSTRALYGPDQQTVATYEGVAGVTATAFGSPFDVSPRGAPHLALDGDLTTAWTFGAFGTAQDQSLVIDLDEDRELGAVTVTVGQQPGPVRITAMTLAAGTERQTTDVGVDGVARFPMVGVTTDQLRLSVAKTSGDGFNLVGIAEVSIPGLRATRVARMPVGLSKLAAGLDETQRQLLAATPLDVVMQRERGTTPDADDERSMQRDFTLPDQRLFRIYGIVRGDRTMTALPQAEPDGCFAVGTIDAAPLRVRLLEADVSSDRGALFEGCAPLRLAGGAHQLRASPPWTLDNLVLRDLGGESVTKPGPTPETAVAQRTNTQITVATSRASEPFLLVLGQSLDSRWRATIDGRPLGAAVVVDGYSAAWEVTDPGPHVFSFTYQPQRLVTISRWVTFAVLVLLVVLCVRRRPGVVPAVVAEPRHCPPTRRRRGLESLLIALVVTASGGWPLAPVGIALALLHLTQRPRPRTLLSVAVAVFLAVPVAWVLGNLDRWGEITPALVTDNPWPGWLAATGLALLVVGVLDDDRDLAIRRGAPRERATS